jgi:hypothetical protein
VFDGSQPLVVRLSWILAAAVVGGMGIAFLSWAATDWTLEDANAYWLAALRLRAGQELYPVIRDVESSDIYRYSPWFAWLVVPITYLPPSVAAIAWSLVLLGASAAAIWPLLRERRYLHAAFFGPILIAISASGNVHALLVAALVHGVERRSGPLWIAMAASLKAVPVLLVLVYLGRRQWTNAWLTLGLAVALVAPMLLYDLSNYPFGPGSGGPVIRWPPAYLAAVAVGAAATLTLARTRYGWLASAATAALALPRFFTYDVTLLLVGTVRRAPKSSTR